MISLIVANHNIHTYFKPSKKNLVAYIHWKGNSESFLVSKAIKMFGTSTITMSAMPAHIYDPNKQEQ